MALQLYACRLFACERALIAWGDFLAPFACCALLSRPAQEKAPLCVVSTALPETLVIPSEHCVRLVRVHSGPRLWPRPMAILVSAAWHSPVTGTPLSPCVRSSTILHRSRCSNIPAEVEYRRRHHDRDGLFYFRLFRFPMRLFVPMRMRRPQPSLQKSADFPVARFSLAHARQANIRGFFTGVPFKQNFSPRWPRCASRRGNPA